MSLFIGHIVVERLLKAAVVKHNTSIMDKGEALIIAGAYIDSISSKYSIRQAILFGSYAKGTNHDDSDIDIAIVVNNVVDIIDAQIDLMKLRRKIDLRIEPHPFMIGDFNKSNPVVNEILKYGILINKKVAQDIIPAEFTLSG